MPFGSVNVLLTNRNKYCHGDKDFKKFSSCVHYSISSKIKFGWSFLHEIGIAILLKKTPCGGNSAFNVSLQVHNWFSCEVFGIWWCHILSFYIVSGCFNATFWRCLAVSVQQFDIKEVIDCRKVQGCEEMEIQALSVIRLFDAKDKTVILVHGNAHDGMLVYEVKTQNLLFRLVVSQEVWLA